MSIEDRVRESLHRQADEWNLSTDAWQQIVERRRATERPHATRSRPTMRRAVVIAAAFCLFAIATVPLWVAFGPGSIGAAPADRAPVTSGPTPSPHMSKTTTPPPPTAARCTGDQLSAHEVVTDGAAGNVWAPIVLVNDSSEPCTLAGYPSLRFLGAAGEDLHLRYVHSPDNTGLIPPAPISRAPFTLLPGARSWFLLYFSDVQPPCTRVYGIQITPPGGTGTVTMHVNPIHKWALCSVTPTVTAVTPQRPKNAKSAI